MHPRRQPEPLNAFLATLSRCSANDFGLHRIGDLIIDSSIGEKAAGCARLYAAYDRQGCKSRISYTPGIQIQAEARDSEGNLVFREYYEDGEDLQIKALFDAKGNRLIAGGPLADILQRLFEQDDDNNTLIL